MLHDVHLSCLNDFPGMLTGIQYLDTLMRESHKIFALEQDSLNSGLPEVVNFVLVFDEVALQINYVHIVGVQICCLVADHQLEFGGESGLGDEHLGIVHL